MVRWSGSTCPVTSPIGELYSLDLDQLRARVRMRTTGVPVPEHPAVGFPDQPGVDSGRGITCSQRLRDQATDGPPRSEPGGAHSRPSGSPRVSLALAPWRNVARAPGRGVEREGQAADLRRRWAEALLLQLVRLRFLDPALDRLLREPDDFPVPGLDHLREPGGIPVAQLLDRVDPDLLSLRAWGQCPSARRGRSPQPRRLSFRSAASMAGQRGPGADGCRR
jgi:hypothetical protein